MSSLQQLAQDTVCLQVLPTAQQSVAKVLQNLIAQEHGPADEGCWACRDPSQKWQVAEAAFEHMALVLTSLPTYEQLPATRFDPMSPLQPPGFAALLDLLGEPSWGPG